MVKFAVCKDCVEFFEKLLRLNGLYKKLTEYCRIYSIWTVYGLTLTISIIKIENSLKKLKISAKSWLRFFMIEYQWSQQRYWS